VDSGMVGLGRRSATMAERLRARGHGVHAAHPSTPSAPSGPSTPSGPSGPLTAPTD